MQRGMPIVAAAPPIGSGVEANRIFMEKAQAGEAERKAKEIKNVSDIRAFFDRYESVRAFH